MTDQTFSATIYIKPQTEATAEQLKAAIEYMLQRAVKYPPDGRFDWANAYVESDKE